MVAKLPFLLKEPEERELRDCGQAFFKGVNPSYDKELSPFWFKWSMFFEVFAISKNSKYGDFNFLPFEGGIFDQPYKTMQVLLVIQGLYREKLEEEEKKALAKMKKTR